MSPRHWLVGALDEREGLGDLDLSADTPIADAWDRVTSASGLDSAELAQRVADAYGLETMGTREPDPGALDLLPGGWAAEHLVLPLEATDSKIRVAVADPRDLDVEEEIGFMTDRRVELVVAPPDRLRDRIRDFYEPDRSADETAARIGDADADMEVDRRRDTYEVSREDGEAGPVVRLTNRIFADAIDARASDVHLAFEDDVGTVRYRVDGVMRAHLEIPHPVMRRVIARVKVIGGLDVSDSLRPQDGRLRITMEGNPYDLRISTVPTRGTEKAVLRILDPNATPDLGGLGLREREREDLEALLRHNEGIVFVTGPTGSGKTTTLYACLRRLATEEVNIMTVEDPVEYELSGVTQVQVEPRQDVTFASALRSILRQDPDIVLVGEIRDTETAEIAVQASLTGHLVLATLHTNDAIGAVRRLTDLGLDRAAIAETLRGVIAQRLVRRLCPECRREVNPESPPDPDLARKYGVEPTMDATGCSHCSDSGYRGRLPVSEIVTMSPELREKILEGAPPARIYEIARQQGTRRLLESGLERVESGETTLGEIDRVLGGDPAAGDRARDASVTAAEATSDAIPDSQTGAAAAEHDSTGEPEADQSEVTAAEAGGTDATGSAREPSPEDGRDADSTGWSAAGSGRVLVAEDDGVTRQMIRGVLEGAGYEVTEAEEGFEAIRILQEDPEFALLITDLQMPEMSGRSLLHQVRTTESIAGLPVIVVTGSTGVEEEAALIEQGADDYIEKPLDPERLAARVRATLRRSGGG